MPKEKDYGFIQPHNGEESSLDTDKDIYFHFEKLQSNHLTLKRDDTVEFGLYETKKGKRQAVKVMVRKLQNRSDLELKTYFHQITTTILEENDNKAKSKQQEYISQLLASSYIWEAIANSVNRFSNDDELLRKFLQLILLLESTMNTLDQRFAEILKAITRTKFFSLLRYGRLKTFISECSLESRTDKGNKTPSKIMYKGVVYTESISEDEKNEERKNSIDLIQQFLKIVANYVPEKLPAVIGLIQPLVEQHNITLTFLYALLKMTSQMNVECITDISWEHMPLILTNEEMFSSELNDQMHLEPVQVKGKSFR